MDSRVPSPVPERTVITDLPVGLAILPGEAELVHHHLRDCLAALFGEVEFDPQDVLDKMK